MLRDNSPDPESRRRFTPSVLPTYLHRTEAIEELIPLALISKASTKRGIDRRVAASRKIASNY